MDLLPDGPQQQKKTRSLVLLCSVVSQHVQTSVSLCDCVTLGTHRLLDDVGPLRRDSVLGVLLKEATEVLEGRSEGSAHLACVPPVDDLNPLLPRQAVDVDLVRVPAAVPLLLGPPVLEVELHLHLVHPLDVTPRPLLEPP